MNQTNKEIENSQKDIKSGYLGEEGDDVLVYTTNQTNSRIREEWENKLRNKWETFSVVNDYYENADIRLNSDKIADFFIPKIAELLKSQREELVEKIKAIDVGYMGIDNAPVLKNSIISLIKNN